MCPLLAYRYVHRSLDIQQIKPKHLDGLEIAPPVSSRTARVGSLTRKNVTHDVWSIGDDDADVMGGDDVRGLSCLLPRKKKKGKLCLGIGVLIHHMTWR